MTIATDPSNITGGASANKGAGKGTVKAPPTTMSVNSGWSYKATIHSYPKTKLTPKKPITHKKQLKLTIFFQNNSKKKKHK